MAKPTNKERDTQLAWLTGQISNLNRLFGAYIDFRGQSADFQKHLVDLNEKLKKEAKDDTKTNN
jgi:hypothetical protein|tara:strand:- start:23 stop:214 length:192 start_codon:yes stop_codon:yes gene_type:complete